MAGIPPELTSSALTALAVLGAWFGTYLARKGKREDNKIAASNQSFAQLQAVADERAKDNERLSRDNERLRNLLDTYWNRDHPQEGQPPTGGRP